MGSYDLSNTTKFYSIHLPELHVSTCIGLSSIRTLRKICTTDNVDLKIKIIDVLRRSEGI